jgi:tetratricopeptide (TPR) repeat protein
MTMPELPKSLQDAMQASQAGDSTSALRLFEAAIAQSPADPLSHFLFAAELAQTGKMNEAEAAYARTVLLAPRFETARFQLGLLQFTSGRPAVALLTWRPLLELPDTNAFHRFVLGFAALAQDQFGEAAHHLRQGMLVNEGNAPLNADIKQVLQRIEPLINATGVPASSAPEDELQPSHHVLLSNYQQDGPAH